MAADFAAKFEEALEDAKARGITLRELARRLAGETADPKRVENVRRLLYKYRPPKGGGAAETAPTEPTRHEIEAVLGLERDALAPDLTDELAAMLPMRAEAEAITEAVMGALASAIAKARR